MIITVLWNWQSGDIYLMSVYNHLSGFVMQNGHGEKIANKSNFIKRKRSKSENREGMLLFSVYKSCMALL